MPRGTWLLLFSITLTPPTAGALGLGDIHVDSDLNQPLIARIDLIGATAEELRALSAAVANRDAFLRAGAERPAYLSNIVFQVASDQDGRAILALHSSESFTDPLVSLLVDLRWPNGELIREYTLMLDPADASFRARLAAASSTPAAARLAATTAGAATAGATVAAATAVAASHPAMPASRGTLAPAAAAASSAAHVPSSHRHVLANASLRRLARRAGAHGRTDVHRMMLAIYRANPNAFGGNITRLHRGAMLTIPTRDEVNALPRTMAEREYQALLRAARNSPPGRDAASTRVTVSTAAASAPPRATQAQAAAPAAAVDVDAGATAHSKSGANLPASALEERVRSLERSIDELKSLLANEHAKFVWLQEHAAERSAPTSTAASPSTTWSRALSISVVTPIAAALSFLLGLTAALRWRRTRAPAAVVTAPLEPAPMPRPSAPASDAPFAAPLAKVAPTAERPQSAAPVAPRAAPASPPRPPTHEIGFSVMESVDDEESAELQALAAVLEDSFAASNSTAEITIETPPPKPIREATFVYGGDTTAVMALDPEDLFGETVVGMENVKLDYNLTDLDTTAQHVHLPSSLNDRAQAEEQPTDIIDVLKQAIDRDPHRRDLQMKLLEVYFSQMNRDEFLALAEKLAQNREQLTSIDWQKVLMMGRQIAPDETLFKGDGTRSTFAA